MFAEYSSPFAHISRVRRHSRKVRWWLLSNAHMWLAAGAEEGGAAGDDDTAVRMSLRSKCLESSTKLARDIAAALCMLEYEHEGVSDSGDAIRVGHHASTPVVTRRLHRPSRDWGVGRMAERRGMLAVSMWAMGVWLTGPAHGNTWDDSGQMIARLHVTHDESIGVADHASLDLYDQTTADPKGGYLSATCIDGGFGPSLSVDLNLRTGHRPQVDDTESLRTRIDRGGLSAWEAVISQYDLSKYDGKPATFVTSGDVPDKLVRGLIADMAGGKRMIFQIANLPVVTLDLATAKEDIVEFRSACEGMLRHFERSPHSVARIGSEVDPFTDEGLHQLELLDWTRHRDQPWSVGVLCGRLGEWSGVAFFLAEWWLFQGTVPDKPKSVHLRIDSEDARELGLSEKSSVSAPHRGFQVDLSPHVAMALVNRLSTAHTMVLDTEGLPAQRLDLVKGRPVIADFAAKCRTVVEALDS